MCPKTGVGRRKNIATIVINTPCGSFITKINFSHLLSTPWTLLFHLIFFIIIIYVFLKKGNIVSKGQIISHLGIAAFLRILRKRMIQSFHQFTWMHQFCEETLNMWQCSYQRDVGKGFFDVQKNIFIFPQNQLGVHFHIFDSLDLTPLSQSVCGWIGKNPNLDTYCEVQILHQFDKLHEKTLVNQKDEWKKLYNVWHFVDLAGDWT